MLVWLKKINWKKVLIASVAFTVISFVIRQVEAVLTMKYYMMPEYFGVWSKVMMPKAGPPPLSFFFLSLVFSLISGLTLATFYDFVKKLLPQNFWKRVLNFTDLTIALVLVFAYLPLYLLINLPLELLVSWFVSSTITVLLATMVFVKILK